MYQSSIFFKSFKIFLTKTLIVVSIFASALYAGIKVYAVYYPTDNITNPSCAPGASGCYVSLIPEISGRSIIYLPDQTNFLGTVYMGSNGGANLLHSSSTQGQQNTYVGINSGNANTTAFNNTGIGYNALASNTTGFRIVAVGAGALASNTTANFSTAVGERALTNDNGGSNTAVGFFSGGNNLTGTGNNSFGRESLESNISGTENNAFGNFSLGNVTGSGNTAFGAQSGRGASGNASVTGNSLFGYVAGLNLANSSNYNTLVGYQAGSGISAGANNTIIGARTVGSTVSSVTTGSNNILLGFNAGYGTGGATVGTGSNNVIIGNQFLNYNIPSALSDTILIGDGAGVLRIFSNNTGTIIGNITTAATVAPNSTLDVYGKLSLNGRTAMYYPGTTTFANTIFIGNGGGSLTSTVFGDGQLNTAVGIGSMFSITTGYGNTAVGNESMNLVTTGSVSAAFGSHALGHWLTGTDNAAFGVDTLHDLTNASFNSGFGTSVLFTTTTGTHNAGFGVDTFYYNLTGSYNTGMGNNAGKSMTGGNSNTFMGYLSAAGSSGSFTSTGSTALGTSSLQYLSTGGDYNTAIGMNAGLNNTTGTINTYLGYNTGLGITTGSKNTIIGANVTGLSSSLSNNIIIADGDGNQRIKVGNTGAVTLSALVSCGGVQTNASGVLSCTSDETMKDINSNFTKGLDSIRNINPISYSWKNDTYLYDGGVIYNGFSAQNVQTALGGDATSLSSDGHIQISQLAILASTVNAIKELDIKVNLLNSLDISNTNSVGYLMKSFLANVDNQIGDLYAKIIHTDKVQTKELCVGDVCVTESQFLEIVNNAHVTQIPSSNPDPSPVPDLVPNPDPVVPSPETIAPSVE